MEEKEIQKLIQAGENQEIEFKTAYKELSDLVKREILLQKGKGRSTYYVLR